MSRGSRIVWVRLRLMVAVVAAALFPMVAGGTVASADAVVPYQFDGLAFYQSGDPADKLPAAPSAGTDTGFIRITNSGGATVVGTDRFPRQRRKGIGHRQFFNPALNPGGSVIHSIKNAKSKQDA